MANGTSTITAKWQVTIPEDVRKELPLRIGERIVWDVEGERLVGRRVRSARELAGCLKSERVLPSKRSSPGSLAEAATARHERLSKKNS